jgi:hypothetical protein
MTTYPQNQYFSGTVAGTSKIFDYVDCLGMSSVSLMAFSNVAFSMDFLWSMDNGINTDLTQSSGNLLAAATYSKTHQVKSRYLKIRFNDTALVSGSTLRLQLSLNSKTGSNISLENLGIGIEIYDDSNSGVRSVTSSDGSVGVVLTGGGKEIDITVAASGFTPAYFSGSITNTTATTAIDTPVSFVQDYISGMTSYSSGTLTIATTGLYICSFCFRTDATEVIGFKINASAIEERYYVSMRGTDISASGNMLLSLTAADTVSVQSDSSSITLNSGGTRLGANFVIHRIA